MLGLQTIGGRMVNMKAAQNDIDAKVIKKIKHCARVIQKVLV